MPYQKTIWKSRDLITASKMNNIETGIENLEEKILNPNNSTIFVVEYGVTTTAEVYAAKTAGKQIFANKDGVYYPLIEGGDTEIETSEYALVDGNGLAVNRLTLSNPAIWSFNVIDLTENDKTERVNRMLADYNSTSLIEPHLVRETTTINNVTFTWNDDGSCTLSREGTQTATAEYLLLPTMPLPHGIIAGQKYSIIFKSPDAQSIRLILTMYGDGALEEYDTGSSGDFTIPEGITSIRIKLSVSKFAELGTFAPDKTVDEIALLAHKPYWMSIDNTLTKAGLAADAKATGDRISELENEIDTIFIATYGTTTTTEIYTAKSAGKQIFANKNGIYYPLVGGGNTSTGVSTYALADSNGHVINTLLLTNPSTWTSSSTELAESDSPVLTNARASETPAASSNDTHLATTAFVQTAVSNATILTSPNGTNYKLKVANDGTLSTEIIT